MAEEQLPAIFRKDSPYIVSYNFVDVVSGQGYKVFYGIDSITDAGTTYFLTDQSMFRSQKIVGTSSATTNGIISLKTGATLNFETNIFNRPATINGFPIVNLSFRLSVNGGSAENKIINCKLVLVHADTSTTDLTASVQVTMANSASIIYINPFFKLAEVTNKEVKKGEKLRIVLTATESGASDDWYIYCDPSNDNLEVNQASKELLIAIPFKIQT